MTLKWGVLGAGSVAQRRAMPAINKAKDAELHALLSRGRRPRKNDWHMNTAQRTPIPPLMHS